jgi:Ca2+-binding RTX toxin-like protein
LLDLSTVLRHLNRSTPLFPKEWVYTQIQAIGSYDMSTITGDNTPNTLTGAATADSISGLAGIDQLSGLAGNDTLTGGSDDDTLTGGEGADTYVFNLGDGNDTINNTQTVAAADYIQFGAGITAANVQLNKEGNDLVITLTNSPSDSIRVINQFSDPTAVLGILQFSDATTLNIAPTTLTNTLYLTGGLNGETLIGYDGQDIIYGNGGGDSISGGGGDDSLDGGTGGDTLDGGTGNDTLIGGVGNDTLLGKDGTDTLIGGTGDDLLTGGEGADSYLFNLGDGNDTINNVQTVTAADKLILGAGFTAANLRLYRDGNDLVVTFINNTDDSIRIQNQFTDPLSVLPTLQFSDATTLSIDPTAFSSTLYSNGTAGGDYLAGFVGNDYMWGNGGNDNLTSLAGSDHLDGGAGNDYLDGGADSDYLLGGAGNDTLLGGADIDLLTGGTGDDLLSGGEGADQYYFNPGDGDDTINNQQTVAAADKIILGAGFSAANVVLNRQGNDLLITFNNGSHDSIRITGQFYDPSFQLNTIQFSDASTLDISPTALTNTTYINGYNVAEYTLGTVGNDVMLGNGGHDTLLGMSGNDSLNGGLGEDYLDAGDGNDTLVGGIGDDTLIGGEGTDTYLYGLGDGNDIIGNSQTVSAPDQLIFGAGIMAANLVYNRVSYDLVISFNNSANDSIRIANYFAGSQYQLNNLVFSDASTLSVASALLTASVYSNDTDASANLIGFDGTDVINGNGGNDQLYGYGSTDSLSGGTGNDIIDGGDGNDTLQGGSGNDVLTADAGDDVLTGGIGDDSMSGGEGTDIYNYALGDGQDTINNYQGTIAPDKLVLGAGFTAANLQFSVDGNDLVIQFSNSSTDIIHIYNQLAGSANYQLQTIQFSDNSTLALPTVATGLAAYVVGSNGNDTYTGGGSDTSVNTGAGSDLLQDSSANDGLYGGAGNDMIYGGAGNDVLSGGSGDDLLQGDEGADSYKFNLGDGNDTINNQQTVAANDQIIFGLGITAANLIYSRVGDDLIISLSNSPADSLRVRNQFAADTSYHLTYIRLDDATILNTPTPGDSSIVYSTGTSSYDTLNGYDGTDVMNGNAGADSLTGAGGNDTLNGGTGSDSIYGGDGNDVLSGGTGDDSLNGGEGADSYLFNLGDGNDTLNNIETTVAADKIIFGAGISAANVVLNRAGNDLLITLTNSSTDSIRVLNQFATDPSSILSTLQFSDASTLTTTSLTNTLYSSGYDYSSDTLDGFDGSDVISGLGGYDVEHGLGGTDSLSGGYGNDQLFGGDGADTLNGGSGDDYLEGDEGADRYVYALGDGNDTISNLQTTVAADVLVLGAGITAANVRLNREYGDLVITFTNSPSDSIRLLNQFANPSAVLATLQFSDASTLSLDPAALTTTLLTTGSNSNENLIGVESADTMYGNGGGDILQGNGGNDFLIGGSGGDYLLGGSGNDYVEGDSGNDIVYGNDGIDTLNGGTGDDTLSGGEGADTYSYSVGDGQDVINNQQTVAAADVISFGAGITAASLHLTREANDLVITFIGSPNDSIRIINQYSDPNYALNTLRFSDASTLNVGVAALSNTFYQSGGSGNDFLYGYNGADVISGNSGGDYINSFGGDDTLLGGAGQDTMYGGDGNDLLDGGIGADVMQGGLGDDQYIVDNAYDQISEATGAGFDRVQSSISYALTLNVENLTLTGSALNGIGNALANSITGNSANNILNGGGGADTLIGGLGNDLYVVDNIGDVVVEGAAAGTDTIQSSVTYLLGANVENLALSGTADIDAIGNSLANTLTGNSGNNILNGGGGADTMIGGLGDDLYVVDNVGDVVTENANVGIDTVQTALTYTLSANVENLKQTGSAAINGIGNTLANTLTGNSGNNVLNGGGGADTLIGGLGDDLYVIDNIGDVITEAASAGTDSVQSSVSYTLGANLENLTLTGTATLSATGNTLANVLTGNSANNTLTGDLGNDTLNGGAGADTLVGGQGGDTYIVDNIGDVITEAASSGTDTVQSAVTYTLGANLENLTLIGSGAINATGNTLANVLTGNSGNNILTGSSGNDSYSLSRSSGHDTLVDSDSSAGNNDRLLFASDVSYSQLWFKHVGNDLQIDIIGTANAATIKDWYLSGANHIETLISGDSKTLTDNHVQNLVNAMATMTEPGSGQTTLSPAQATALAPVFTANWT